ncbi:MAG TPA: hypothetical protein VKK79_20425, partial [Candidatus Lokiarchaeia archaeon]|nr:hypothetical protein [Candidatus Lokiarchaeia archaeon]
MSRPNKASGKTAASPKKAKTRLEQLLEQVSLQQYNSIALVNLGVCYEQAQDWTNAYNTYLRILNFRPDADDVRAKLFAAGEALGKNPADIEMEAPPRVSLEPLPHPCPCCGKDVTDPTHVNVVNFILMFNYIIQAEKRQKGRVDLKFDATSFNVFDPNEGRKVNLIHKYLKLDGTKGHPRVDGLFELIKFLGWGSVKLETIMVGIGKSPMYTEFFYAFNEVNPTLEEPYDITDLIAVIRDGGWGFYEAILSLPGTDILNSQKELDPKHVPALDEQIYVGGQAGGQLSFPTYLCNNTFQARQVTWGSWGDFLRAVRNPAQLLFLLNGFKELHENNHFWADLWWIAHQRLNGAETGEVVVPTEEPIQRRDAASKGAIQKPKIAAKETKVAVKITPDKIPARLITCKKCGWSYSAQKGNCPMCGEPPAPMDVEDFGMMLMRMIERKGIIVDEKETQDFVKKFQKQYRRFPDETELLKAANDYVKMLTAAPKPTAKETAAKKKPPAKAPKGTKPPTEEEGAEQEEAEEEAVKEQAPKGKPSKEKKAKEKKAKEKKTKEKAPKEKPSKQVAEPKKDDRSLDDVLNLQAKMEELKQKKAAAKQAQVPAAGVEKVAKPAATVAPPATAKATPTKVALAKPQAVKLAAAPPMAPVTKPAPAQAKEIKCPECGASNPGGSKFCL